MYLHAKSAGNKESTDSVEFKRPFWASGGQWLNGSILMSLTRNILGIELPDFVKEKSFFHAETSQDEAELSSEISAGKITQTTVRKLVAQEDFEQASTCSKLDCDRVYRTEISCYLC